MTFKSVITALLILACVCLSAFAQTPTLPTYIGAGVAFNQIGEPRANLWATAIYPVASSLGVFGSTTTDVIPVLRVDPASMRQYYAFTTSIRQGAHKTVFSSGKITALIGGDAGVQLNQAAPSGMSVGFAGSFTATGVYQLSPKFALIVPIRGLWVNSSWNLVPQLGVVFKP